MQIRTYGVKFIVRMIRQQYLDLFSMLASVSGHQNFFSKSFAMRGSGSARLVGMKEERCHREDVLPLPDTFNVEIAICPPLHSLRSGIGGVAVRPRVNHSLMADAGYR